MLRSIVCSVIVITTAHPILAETLRVPQDYRTIQSAIDILDGFTITNVGTYDAAQWQHLHAEPASRNWHLNGRIGAYD